MKRLFFNLILVIFMNSIINQDLAAQPWTLENATKWCNEGKYLNGLQIKPHEAVNKIEFAKQYHGDKALWDKVFAWMKETNLETIAVGKYPIDGDKAFAIISDGPAKAFEDAKWETHNKYIDIQCVIRGKEKMGVLPVERAKVTTPYNAEKDVAFYTSDEGCYYVAEPGKFLLFFPSDVHRPAIKVEGSDTVKKLVVKVKVN